MSLHRQKFGGATRGNATDSLWGMERECPLPLVAVRWSTYPPIPVPACAGMTFLRGDDIPFAGITFLRGDDIPFAGMTFLRRGDNLYAGV